MLAASALLDLILLLAATGLIAAEPALDLTSLDGSASPLGHRARRAFGLLRFVACGQPRLEPLRRRA